MITTRDLAAELGVPADDIDVLAGQLVDLDGEDAVVADSRAVVNASGRQVGVETTLTDEAAQAVREQITAQD
ncbi:hypothetical protein [Streptomyces luteireticuli]|uniref:hypothetical protein n=1 Tax=Streptomyces luteireticuli TaxID=173858 RepID=UPI0035570F2D